MNDRFKFRVWSEEYKMYVKDNHYPIGGDYSLSMTPNGYVEVIGMGDYNDDGAFSWGSIDSLEDSAGDCIVEQCTGLKDKNGNLIYEGDWLKTKDGYYCYVVWFDGFWWAKSLPSEAMDLEYAEFYKECEVIGNIHTENINDM